jgi:hypothetical protein
MCHNWSLGSAFLHSEKRYAQVLPADPKLGGRVKHINYRIHSVDASLSCKVVPTSFKREEYVV